MIKQIQDRLQYYSRHPAAIRSRTAQIFIKIFLYALLIAAAYVCLFPFLYMLITSFKTNQDLNDITVNWIPSTLKWENFTLAIKSLDYGRSLSNTVVIVLAADIGHILSCSMAGYAFARYRFRGQNLTFALVLVGIVMPIQALIIPSYMLFSELKMLNSFWPLILPTFFGFGLRGPLFIFIFRQFFIGLPKELEEAAKIDGCSFMGAFVRVVFPLARPIVLVVGVLSTVWHWNASYEPSLYLSKDALKPLATKVDVIVDYVNNPPTDLFENIGSVSTEQVINVAVLMAACFLILLPIMVMFVIVQRQFIQGVERSGLTGE